MEPPDCLDIRLSGKWGRVIERKAGLRVLRS